MSNFSVVLDFMGLAPEEAARMFGVEEADILRWRTSNEAPPACVWQQLVTLFDQVRYAAEEVAKSADLDRLSCEDLNRIALPSPIEINAPEGPRRAVTAMALTTLARVFVR